MAEVLEHTNSPEQACCIATWLQDRNPFGVYGVEQRSSSEWVVVLLGYKVYDPKLWR